MDSLVKEEMKRSPLHACHEALHAKFGSFGGWELPLYYTSILQEHKTVRTKVGVFDVSHLAHLEVSGEGTLRGLQAIVTQDLSRCVVGRAVYSPMLNENGFILDEMILYRLPATKIGGSVLPSGGEEKFRLVVNAANGDKILRWLKNHLPSSLKVEDLRENFGTLAVQGPLAVEWISSLAREPLAEKPRYSIRSGALNGRSIFFARTGYTGEDGFELFVPTQDLETIWNFLLRSGEAVGARPIGLGARDTLRLEAGLPLGGSDLDEMTTPLEAGLEWTVSWGKGSFIGRDALERQKKEGIHRRLVGFRLTGSGIPRPHHSIFRGGQKIGMVTSGTFLPVSLSREAQARPQGVGGQGIGLGYVPPDAQKEGTEIFIEIHGRQVPAKVVKLPFYRRKK